MNNIITLFSPEIIEFIMTLHLRIPSEELLNLIKEVGKMVTKLSELFEAVKQKGHEEGFTDSEIKDMLRTHLKGSLSAGQVKWYLYEKEKYDSRKAGAGTSQVEDNNVIEQKAKKIILSGQSVNVQDAAIIPNSSATDVIERNTVEMNNGRENKKTEDLKATIEQQRQYINKLEDKLREKHEVQRAQLRIRTSTSQLYRDVLSVGICNATYTNILIDNNKYVRLEP
jgi:hypothetical protein